MEARQQSKRFAKDMPFICRSLYFHDYKETREKLRPDQLILAYYAFLPEDEAHPAT